ncbi:hypothetical protein EIP86_000018 [Pleurotus ostreatoroseus]|nr:hypothetical protein EIP86_000018 [Pleurotus ostreatoroseus]
MGIASDVYAQELSSYNHGLPLWSPEPADAYEVRVGDVGYIDEDGQFHRLFNVTVDANHPYNVDPETGESCVPTDFHPLQFNSRLFSIKPKQFPPGPLPSRSVKSHEIGGSASVSDPTGLVGGGFSYSFNCAKEQGAFLVLMEDAKKTVVPPAVNFTTYMRKNHSSWYEFATHSQNYGLACKPEDIILVRGSVKTSAWALGAYTENGNHVHDVSFSGQGASFASAGFKWASSNQSSARFEHRIGPSDAPSLRRLTSGRSGRSTIASGKAVARPTTNELPEITAERKMGIEAAIDADNTDDQCVFLSYYKIKYRIFSFKKITAAAGPAELPDGDDDNEGSPAVLMDTDPEIELVPSPTKLRTDAQVAIASDGDVEELLDGCEVPEDFPRYLRDIMPKIDVDENGTGTLSIEEAIRRTHRHAAANAEQLAAEQIHMQLELQYEQAQIEAAQAAEIAAQVEAAESDPDQGAQPMDTEPTGPSASTSTAPPADTTGTVPTVPPTETLTDAPGDGPAPPSDEVPAEDALIPGSSFLSSAEPRMTGSNMSQEGSLILPKRGPNAKAVPWLHIMLMDKDAEGGSVTDMSVCEKENGRYAATGCEDCAVRIWDLETGVLYAKLEEHEDTVWAVAFSPDGTKIVSGGADQKAVLWNVEERTIIARLNGHEGDVWTLAYSPNGKFIATGSVDRTVRLWDGRNGDLLTKLPDHSAVVMMVKFTPDSTRLVTCGDCTGHICDVASGHILAKLNGHTGIIWDLDFAQDSSRVVTAAEDYTARIWNLEDGMELCTLREHGGPVWTAAFSPDDREVTTGSYDCLLAMCDSYTGDQHHILGQENPAIINTVNYSKDGDFITAGGADGNVRFWDARSGELMATFQGHEDKVKKTVFTPDGNRIISSSDDGTVRVWSVRDVLRL